MECIDTLAFVQLQTRTSSAQRYSTLSLRVLQVSFQKARKNGKQSRHVHGHIPCFLKVRVTSAMKELSFYSSDLR